MDDPEVPSLGTSVSWPIYVNKEVVSAIVDDECLFLYFEVMSNVFDVVNVRVLVVVRISVLDLFAVGASESLVIAL